MNEQDRATRDAIVGTHPHWMLNQLARWAAHELVYDEDQRGVQGVRAQLENENDGDGFTLDHVTPSHVARHEHVHLSTAELEEVLQLAEGYMGEVL